MARLSATSISRPCTNGDAYPRQPEHERGGVLREAKGRRGQAGARSRHAERVRDASRRSRPSSTARRRRARSGAPRSRGRPRSGAGRPRGRRSATRSIAFAPSPMRRMRPAAMPRASGSHPRAPRPTTVEMRAMTTGARRALVRGARDLLGAPLGQAIRRVGTHRRLLVQRLPRHEAVHAERAAEDDALHPRLGARHRSRSPCLAR